MNIQHADTTTLQGVAIPEAFKIPDWVPGTLQKFKDAVKTSKNNGKINNAVVRDAIKNIILDGKISPPFPLKKANIKKLLHKMYETFDDEEFQWRYMLLYQIGFYLSTFEANSFTPASLELPTPFKKRRNAIIDEYKKRLDEAKTEVQRERVIFWVNKEFKNLAKEVLDYFREHPDEYPIIDSFDSGAKGSPDDLRKLLIAVGLSINAKGEINDVIGRSHAEGLKPTQFFNYTSQAIVSQYKKSRETAQPGYLIRQLNTIAAGVRLSKTLDCNTKGRLTLKILNKDMLIALDGKLYDGGVIGPNDTHLIGKTVKIRSPLYCKAQDGICHACYNPKYIKKMRLEENAGIGLLASTSQASILTTITLKSAHVGLSLNQKEVNFLEDVYAYSE